MTETIVPLNVECSPEAAVSGAMLLQSEYSTILVFNAMQSRDGGYEPVGLAIAEFNRCAITKFGYPNDEAWFSIPRTRKLSYGLYEVYDSSWKQEILELNRHAFPDTEMSDDRHFLFLFHDSAFECIASSMTLTITREARATVLARLAERLDRD